MFGLPEKVTIWNKSGSDGFKSGWDAPVVASARTALKAEKITDKNGDVKMSKAVFYSSEITLNLDSKVVFGEVALLIPPPTANDVIMLTQTPSGAGDLKKAWL